MIRKLLVILYSLFSIAFLIYLVMPGASSIDDFKALPNSALSTLEGDTIQVPDVAGYFSNNYRNFVIPYYLSNFQANTLFPFKPMRLNYPPEEAYSKIKDQTQSTYLEEISYPLRDSLFINGLEPLTESGEPRYQGADKIEYDGIRFSTKVTIRYYSSSIPSRIIMWLGVNLSVVALLFVSRKVLKNG